MHHNLVHLELQVVLYLNTPCPIQKSYMSIVHQVRRAASLNASLLQTIVLYSQSFNCMQT